MWLIYVLSILLLACLGLFCYLVCKAWQREGFKDESLIKDVQQTKR